MPRSLARRLTLLLQLKGARAVEATLTRMRTLLRSVGRAARVAATLGLAALAGILGATVFASVQFESAFAGVIKTVEEATDKFGNLNAVGLQLRTEIRELAIDVPTSAKELANMAEVAGQLGIKAKDLTNFTFVIAKLAETTNIMGQEGALNFARFLNITQTGVGQVERLGSAIVALGNNFAAQEAQILHIATNLASLSSTLGISSQDVLALSTAVAASGGHAEAAATTFQKMALDIDKAVAQAGGDLEAFAKVSNVTASEFARVWEQDAFQGLVLFLQGIESQILAGHNLSVVLESVGIKQVRFTREIAKVVSNLRQLEGAQVVANEAFARGTDLQKEFGIRTRTTAAQFAIFRNTVTEVFIALGDKLLPTIVKGINKMRNLVLNIRENWESISSAIGEAAKAIGNFINDFIIQPIKTFASLAFKVLSAVAGWFNIQVPEAVGSASASFKDLINTLKSLFAETTRAPRGPLLPEITDTGGAGGEQVKRLASRGQELASAIGEPLEEVFVHTIPSAMNQMLNNLDTMAEKLLFISDLLTDKFGAGASAIFEGLAGAGKTAMSTIQKSVQAFVAGETKRFITFGQLTDQIWRGFAASALEAVAKKLQAQAKSLAVDALEAAGRGLLFGEPGAFAAAAKFAAGAALAGGAAAAVSGLAGGIRRKGEENLASALEQPLPLTEAERAAGLVTTRGGGSTTRGGVTQLAPQNITIAPNTTFIAQDGGVVAIGSGGIEEAEENLGNFVVNRIRKALEGGELGIA